MSTFLLNPERALCDSSLERHCDQLVRKTSLSYALQDTLKLLLFKCHDAQCLCSDRLKSVINVITKFYFAAGLTCHVSSKDTFQESLNGQENPQQIIKGTDRF